MIPKDPVILLSYVNTWLRDHEGDFDEFIKSHALSGEQGAELIAKLEAIGYRLDDTKRKFV